jgi:hypothetical protein
MNFFGKFLNFPITATEEKGWQTKGFNHKTLKPIDLRIF